jgi:hypothetical protein
MNYDDIAFRVADLVATESPGTKVIVWTDGSVTSAYTAQNPVVLPGEDPRPAAFFVAGIDRPIVDDITLRIRRAVPRPLSYAS